MRPTLRSTLLALGAASFLGLLEVLRTSLTRVLDGNPTSPMLLVHRLIPMWIMLVLLSPWCAVMARRFPLRPGRVPRTLAAHTLGGMVFVALHMALMGTYHNLMRRHDPWPMGPDLFHLYAFYIGMEMSVYAAIVIVLLLFEARREATERSVAEARLGQSLSAARLASLQAQIQPHFLFNTLNALAVLARRGDGAAVDRAIGDLGELLRTSFDRSGRHEIPLGEELEFLDRYVSLQRIRFPDRLEVEWDIDPAARTALVPPLVVQPLVENALEHGLATARGGRVRVAAHRAGDALEITVADDGPGFAARAAAGAAAGSLPDGSTAPAPSGGLGLANTRERLALLYGDLGSLELGDGAGGGGRVRIRIPWREAGGRAEP
jgi:hypothetical protein